MNGVDEHPASRVPALVLLGATGSGKTPLGQQIEARGLWEKRCLHFDFGANLRAVVAGYSPHHQPKCPGHGTSDPAVTRRASAAGGGGSTPFTVEEIDFLRSVLESGALLEDEHFPLAERILRSFLAARGADPEKTIVLNGLPRHVGQARALQRIAEVRDVVLLDCTPETILRRIETNVGGDRSDRADDAPAAVARKLALFTRRTAALVEHYRRAGVRVHAVHVTATMTPEQVWRILAEHHGGESGGETGDSLSTTGE